MNNLKSHFWYNKRQRNGILCLVAIILLLQFIYSFADFSSEKKQDMTASEILKFQKEIDSLTLVEIENRKPKIYPFNPNFINDFKGEKLGMTIEEIDRLHDFRKQNKWINTAKQFQKVTKVSDSLFEKISPFFKFPDWVTKQNHQKSFSIAKSGTKWNSSYQQKSYKKRQPKTTNLNKATAEDFATISGIGEKLSQRIIKYRFKLQGFSYENQLYEVWNIDPEVIKRVLQVFKIEERPIIKKLNVNTATFKEVLKNPYINYELCKKIFDYRDEVAELQNISELKNIENFPLNKYDRIVLYLKAE